MRFYKLVSKGGRVSIYLDAFTPLAPFSFCFLFSRVARYAPSRKAKTYGTIAQIHRKLIYRVYLIRVRIPDE